jgi:hypothetical protein
VATVPTGLQSLPARIRLPFHTLTREISSRIHPTTLDLGVAMCSGRLVGALVTIARGQRLSAAIPGVAVAVALIPPIAVAALASRQARVDLGSAPAAGRKSGRHRTERTGPVVARASAERRYQPAAAPPPYCHSAARIAMLPRSTSWTGTRE